MKMRAWISTLASASACGGFAFGQVPPSGATSALAAQTATVHPANQSPTFSMHTAGQPDRAIRVLKMSEYGEADSVAEVQDVQSGHTFTMPGKVVKAMLAGTKPAAVIASAPPAPLPMFQSSPTEIIPTPKPMPPAIGAPVFQPNRVASSILERPPVNPVSESSEVPTVTAVQTIVPNPAVVPATGPKMEPVPEEVKPTLIPPMVAVTITKPAVTLPVEEPKPAPPAVIPIAKMVAAPAPVPSTPVAVTPPKPAAPAEPLFGTRLAPQSEATSTSVKTTPLQVWQPIITAGSPAPLNNSIWQPIAEPTVVPAKAVEKKEELPPTSMNVEPTTTTTTTSCCFDQNTCCTESAPKQQVNPMAMVERCGEKTSGLAQLEAQVREASQSTIYDLLTAAKPADREEAATKLSESRFAHRTEVKAAILKAAIADPAPSVRAHCIECLMKLGHNEVTFRLHLKEVANDGPKIVQVAAQAALAKLKPE
jgi:hypothetical protein